MLHSKRKSNGFINGPIKFIFILVRLQWCNIYPLNFIKAHSQEKSANPNPSSLVYICFYVLFHWKQTKIFDLVGDEKFTHKSRILLLKHIYSHRLGHNAPRTSISLSGKGRKTTINTLCLWLKFLIQKKITQKLDLQSAMS